MGEEDVIRWSNELLDVSMLTVSENATRLAQVMMLASKAYPNLNRLNVSMLDIVLLQDDVLLIFKKISIYIKELEDERR